MDKKWQMSRFRRLVRRDWENTSESKKGKWEDVENNMTRVEPINTDNPGVKFFKYHYDKDDPEKYSLVGFFVESGKTKWIAASVEDEHYVDGEV